MERIEKDIEARPNQRKALSEWLYRPQTQKSIAQSLLDLFQPRQIADAGKTAFLAASAIGQTEEAITAETVDGIINSFAMLEKGDFDGARAAFAQGGQGIRSAFAGKSNKEIGDVLRRAGAPEWAAQWGGLAFMAAVDPFTRVAKVATQSAVTPRQLITNARRSVADLSRKRALNTVQDIKRLSMKEILDKPADLVEYVLNPANTKNISKKMLNTPQELATKEVNSMYDDLSKASHKLSDKWKALRNTVYKEDVSASSIDDIYNSVMGSVATNESRADLISRIHKEFLRNNVMKQTYDRATKRFIITPNSNAKFSDLVNLKSSFSDIINHEVRQTGSSSLGALSTRAKAMLSEKLSLLSPDYAAVSKEHSIFATAGRQLDDALGHGGKIFEKHLDASGELIEGTRLGKLSAQDSNVKALLKYWQNAPGTTDRINMTDGVRSLSQLVDGGTSAADRVTRLKALAAGAEFSAMRPKLTIVSLGGYAGSVIAGAKNKPLVAGAGVLGLVDASERASLATTKFLTNQLSGDVNRLTPKMRALQRLQHATLDQGVYRQMSGRNGSPEDLLDTALSGAFNGNE
jgi:hypothetical protein